MIKLFSKIPATNVVARHKAERRFRFYGLLSVSVSFVFLAMLLSILLWRALPAFTQTKVGVDVSFNASQIAAPEKLSDRVYTRVARQALMRALDIGKLADRQEKRRFHALLSSSAGKQLRQIFLENPDAFAGEKKWAEKKKQAGEKKQAREKKRVWLSLSSDVEDILKGTASRSVVEARRRINDQQMTWIDNLQRQDRFDRFFNGALFERGASNYPELAGIGVAAVGSFIMMVIVLGLSLPLGVGSAIYLEKFSPDNRWTRFIEININNLAAVPSIIFGILGLSLFINVVGLPRSAPIVGGLVLTLMTLPVVIIASRAAIKAVPMSIHEAALSIGASHMQAVFTHTLPLAFPGIMTGTIIGLARALGETAPLLMIGMVAFVTDYPRSIFDPATALPVQIYMWAGAAERAFVSRTAAAIIVLLLFLLLMNAAAIILRHKYEKELS